MQLSETEFGVSDDCKRCKKMPFSLYIQKRSSNLLGLLNSSPSELCAC